MSHNIENNMISYKNEVPWHGLGVKVDPNMSGIEMLKAAGCDFTVQRRAIAMRDGFGKEMLVAPLSGYRAIVRQDTDQVFQVATDRYHPVQNAQIIDLFREYCEAGSASMEVVGALGGGAKFWALAKLNGGDSELQGGDKLKAYNLFATSHDGSLRTIGMGTQKRVVCQNTLFAALGEGKPEFSLKHSAKWTPAMAAKAKQVMGMAVEAVQKLNESAAKLSNVAIDYRDWFNYTSRLLGGDEAVIDPKTTELTKVAQELRDATVSSPGSNLSSARGTLWGALNGVTYYIDHVRGRSRDTGLTSAWFGDGERMKRTALEIALEMAGV